MRDGPLRRQSSRLLARHAATEEGEFIAEWPTVLRRDLTGVVPPFGAKFFMRSVVARKCISIAFRGKTEFLCRIACESWHNDRQTTRKEQEISEMARPCVHGRGTVREMKVLSHALIACFDWWHKSPVLIRGFIDSLGGRRRSRAVDNFIGHQLS